MWREHTQTVTKDNFYAVSCTFSQCKALPLAGATKLRKAMKLGLVKSKTVGQKMLKEVLKAEQSNDSPLQ